MNYLTRCTQRLARSLPGSAVSGSLALPGTSVGSSATRRAREVLASCALYRLVKAQAILMKLRFPGEAASHGFVL